MKGEAGRQGEGRTSTVPACPGMSSTPREGLALRQGVGCCVVGAETIDRPAAPSARGEGASSMVVELTSLLARERDGGRSSDHGV